MLLVALSPFILFLSLCTFLLFLFLLDPTDDPVLESELELIIVFLLSLIWLESLFDDSSVFLIAAPAY